MVEFESRFLVEAIALKQGFRRPCYESWGYVRGGSRRGGGDLALPAGSLLWELGQVQGSLSGAVPLHLALALAAGAAPSEGEPQWDCCPCTWPISRGSDTGRWELGQVQGSPYGASPLHLALARAAGLHEAMLRWQV